ncbi:sugar transferase [Dorea longicatena]|uniref:sugar transferase n=1 Tax=Dorea longicatena TaxID=88431 RepID=UPI000E4BE834|nr:sugar transferase [Dorea longicatena]RGU08247.1 sugar transferase [Dorea longicatena]
MLKRWEDLPEFMKTDEVRPYYETLKKEKISLALKRIMDLVGGIILVVLLALPMLFIAIWIKLDSKGPVFYRQERITTYGKHFKIHKFRTMVSNADKIGTAVTVGNDSRITKVGAKLRGCRLDELPQVFDLISGDSGIIGTTKKNLDFTRVSLA